MSSPIYPPEDIEGAFGLVLVTATAIAIAILGLVMIVKFSRWGAAALMRRRSRLPAARVVGRGGG